MALTLAKHWPTSAEFEDEKATRLHARKPFRDLCERFRGFMEAVDAGVIIDLNYDTAVELLLEAGQRRYLRAIGSDVHWVGPVSASDCLLWKVHGSIDRPATIVLSPTEYHRTYETNALGAQLEALGQRLESVWTVGVGLEDDDIWASLCGARSHFSISALWLGRSEADGRPPDVREKTRPWADLTTAGGREVTVVHGILGETTLVECLDSMARVVVSCTATPPRQGKRRSISQYLLERCRRFDEDYLMRCEQSDPGTLMALVASHRRDFDALREYLLSCTASGLGRRWCPSVDGSNLDGTDPITLAKDFHAVVCVAAELCEEFISARNREGVLVAAAAQAAVGYVVQLSELLALDVEMDFEEWPDTARLGRGQSFLVGENPFFVRLNELDRSNFMHFFSTSKDLTVGSPIVGCSSEHGLSLGDRLLEEDEWEAAVTHVYVRSRPKLSFRATKDSEPVVVDVAKLVHVPPMFPWGFRLSDARWFRQRTTGRVSKRWHLVGTYLPHGRQVCKGGGLRDRGRRAFRLGSRGIVVIGEHDDFIEPAYRAQQDV